MCGTDIYIFMLTVVVPQQNVKILAERVRLEIALLRFL